MEYFRWTATGMAQCERNDYGAMQYCRAYDVNAALVKLRTFYDHARNETKPTQQEMDAALITLMLP